MIVFLAALMGAVAVAGGLVAAFEPFESASAGSVEASEADGLQAILNDSAPGAVVESAEEGSSQISGRLDAEEAAETDRAAALADAGPNSVRCDGVGSPVTCTQVPDSEAIAAVKDGVQLYGRTVYWGISRDMIDRQEPLFASNELVCEDAGSDGTMTCSRVDEVQPTIQVGETLFVTYKPYKVTVDEEGVHGGRIETPTIALVRGSS
jgi:hypothetical protein